MGIEPTFEAWEAPVLPLNYTRRMAVGREFTTDGGRKSPPDGKGMVLVGVEVRVMVDGVCLLRKTGSATINGHAVFPEAILLSMIGRVHHERWLQP